MKKEYNEPCLNEEIIELNDQIFTSGVNKDNGNHSMNQGDLIL